MIMPPAFTGDFALWARRVVDYLIRDREQRVTGVTPIAPQLRHKLDDTERALESGVLMYDPATGDPVISKADGWHGIGQYASDLPAFSAHRSPTTLIAQNTVVTGYAAVLLNNGSHFDPSTGVFTCPEDGLYTFRAQHAVLHTAGLSIGFSLELNGVPINGTENQIVSAANFTFGSDTCATLSLSGGDLIGFKVGTTSYGATPPTVTASLYNFSGHRIG